jgi:hypothetical protein
MEGLKTGDKGITIHKKPNGVAYLYAVESYLDKEKKQSRNKQVCLGRSDDETGEVIPSSRKQRAEQRAVAALGVTASTKVYGPYILLTKPPKDTGLASALKRAFPTPARKS